jgi:hypothetical protein
MKSRNRLGLVLAVILCSPAFAQVAREAPEAPALAATISGVTLYSNQALVVRKGAADVPAARSRWEVVGLPAALRDESLRVRIVAGGASLANLEVATRNKTLFRKKEAEEAERKLKEVQARRKGVSDQIEALTQEAALLKGFEVGKRPDGQKEKPDPAPIDIATWEATLKFIDSALGENQKKARDLAVELDSVDAELAVAEALMQKLSSAKVEASKSAVLELDAPAAGRVELEIAYLVPGPGWWPRYDIRASVETGKVELVSHALVRQETGEDWTGVELTFSAAEPARAADLPELVAWHIGETPAVVAAGSVQSAQKLLDGAISQQATSNVEAFALGAEPAQAKQSAANASAIQQAHNESAPAGFSKSERTRGILGYIAQLRVTNDAALRKNDWNAVVHGNKEMANAIQNLDKTYQTGFADDLMGCTDNITRGERLLKSARLADGIVPPVQSSRGYDYKYRALRPETIPSDGAFNKVVIGVEELPASFFYEAAPELLEVAFLTTRVKNQRRQPYLDGPASVFLGADFVGDARVPTTARGEEFRVNLGADESVQVRRREETKRETTGFFTSYHKFRTVVEVTVKNQKSRSVRLSLFDRLPFTEERDIKLARETLRPPPSEEERKGLLRWDLALEPGAEGKVSFAYTVELPADRSVVRRPDESVKW